MATVGVCVLLRLLWQAHFLFGRKSKMGYLEKHVIGNNDIIKLRPQKNSLVLFFPWLWGILFCWLLLIPTIVAIKKTVKYCTTEYLVTDKKVLEKYGWISTHTDETPLSKIENITVSYTFWGKIFNYSTVSFQGANRNNVNFYYIKNGEEIKKQVNNLIYNN